MTCRVIWRCAGAAAAAAMLAVQLMAQGPPPASRNRRVWTGTIDDREVGLNLTDETPRRRPVRYFHDVQVSFTYVSEDDLERPGRTRWLSRRVKWTAQASSASAIAGVDCAGQGETDLGPTDVSSKVTKDQLELMKIPCTNWESQTNWAIIRLPHPTVRLPRIDLSMKACDPPRRWAELGVRYTLSVSGGDTQAFFRVE